MEAKRNITKAQPSKRYFTAKEVAKKIKKSETSVLALEHSSFSCYNNLQGRPMKEKNRVRTTTNEIKPAFRKGLYTIRQVADKTGRQIRTVRRWAQDLNLPFVDGVRYFTASDIEKKMTRSPVIKRKDITGKKFNHLTAIRFTGKTKKTFKGHDSAVWEWQCICGNIIEKSINEIHHHRNKSCGCENKKLMQKRGPKHLKKIKHFMGTTINSISSNTMRKNNTTGVRGVFFNEPTGKFRVSIGLCNRSIDLGSYETLEEAKQARKAGERKYYQPIIDEYNRKHKKY